MPNEVDSAGQQPLSRREQQRIELRRDATEAARRELAAGGIEHLTLAAVAREVGVTPPALYRHFGGGREGLIRAVYDTVTDEFVDVVAAAAACYDESDVSARLHAATRAVLDWSLAHRAEFDLLMGSNYPRIAATELGIPVVLSRQLGGLYGTLFSRLLHDHDLRYPADHEIRPGLLPQLRTYREGMNLDFPLGVVYLMLKCWRQIYGVVCMAVYEHLAFAFAFDDEEELFEDMMVSILGLLGLERSPAYRR